MNHHDDDDWNILQERLKGLPTPAPELESSEFVLDRCLRILARTNLRAKRRRLAWEHLYGHFIEPSFVGALTLLYLVWTFERALWLLGVSQG